jgi:hypothetical protein
VSPADKEASSEGGGADRPKSYGSILEDEIFQGLGELRRPAAGLFLSGLSAGLDIRQFGHARQSAE